MAAQPWWQQRVDPRGPVSPQQAQIVEKADDLLDTLAEVVPTTTIHYAVEQARQTLTRLIHEAHTIKTNDRGSDADT